jgi:uncharacterized membrane protein
MPCVSDLTILSVVNWFHLVATVVWIGGIILSVTAISSAAKQSLEPPAMGRFMNSFMKRFRIMIYVSIGVLVVTGVFMMFYNKSYAGGMDLGNLWVLLVVVKHVFVLVLIILGIYLLEGVYSKIARLGAKGPSPKLAKLQKLQMSIGMTNMVLGLIILAFTAITGAISAMV